MSKKHKTVITLEEFVEFNLPLLLSLPANMPFHDRHVSHFNTNVLVVHNKHGASRIYSTGFDIFTAKEVRKLFEKSN